MKKPPKPSHAAEDDARRHAGDLRRAGTLARIEEALRKEQKPANGKRRDGDPYNTAGSGSGPWDNGRKR